MIPFSITNDASQQISTDTNGEPQILQFAGFSPNSEYTVYLDPGNWTSGEINFILAEGGSTSYAMSFVMPRDGIVRNIYVIFGSEQDNEIAEGITMYPFACLAVATPNSTQNQINFVIIQNTITYTEPYVGTEAGTLPKFSMRSGSLTNLNEPISAGTLVAIVIGWRGEGVTVAQSGAFSVFGGIYME
jgi:hypothetical protein